MKFEVKEFISKHISLIWPSFNLQIQYGCLCEANVAAALGGQNQGFLDLTYIAVWYIICRKLEVKEFISKHIFLIWPSFNLQIQYGCLWEANMAATLGWQNQGFLDLAYIAVSYIICMKLYVKEIFSKHISFWFDLHLTFKSNMASCERQIWPPPSVGKIRDF